MKFNFNEELPILLLSFLFSALVIVLFKYTMNGWFVFLPIATAIIALIIILIKKLFKKGGKNVKK